jgi:hypothetical protein
MACIAHHKESAWVFLKHHEMYKGIQGGTQDGDKKIELGAYEEAHDDEDENSCLDLEKSAAIFHYVDPSDHFQNHSPGKTEE